MKDTDNFTTLVRFCASLEPWYAAIIKRELQWRINKRNTICQWFLFKKRHRIKGAGAARTIWRKKSCAIAPSVKQQRVTDSTWPVKAASKDRQRSTFCWDSEKGPHFHRGLPSWGRCRKAIQSVLKPLLCTHEHLTQKSVLQDAGFRGTQPADVSVHTVDGGPAIRAVLRAQMRICTNSAL